MTPLFTSWITETWYLCIGSELDMGPFLPTRSNPIHGRIQSMSNSGLDWMSAANVRIGLDSASKNRSNCSLCSCSSPCDETQVCRSLFPSTLTVRLSFRERAFNLSSSDLKRASANEFRSQWYEKCWKIIITGRRSTHYVHRAQWWWRCYSMCS